MVRLLKLAGVVLVAAVVAAAVSVLVTSRSAGQPVSRGPLPQVGQAEGPQPAAQRAAPSVVRVEVGGTASPAPTGGGSGVIVDARGFILTAELVVAGASHISVAIPGGRSLDAHVVGTDPLDGLAVLKVDATGLHAISSATAGPQETGGGVVVMSAPPAFQVAVGVVAAAHATTVIDTLAAPGRARTLNDVLALDVAPRDGQLGAPLLDGGGRLIGVVMRTEGGVVAADMANAQAAVRSIIDTGHSTAPSLGFTYRQLTSTEAADRAVPGGVTLLAVDPGSAAEQAGLKAGDIVVSASGTTLDPTHPLLRVLRGVPVHQSVALLVHPDVGAERTVSLPLALVQE